MKVHLKFLALILLLAILALPAAVRAQGPGEDKYVVGGAYTLEDGEVLNGDLYILGGTATLEDGSTVNGDIFVMGGSLRVNGTVDGSITLTGGLTTLGSNAVVEGDVNTFAGNLDRDPGAVVEGSVNRSGGRFPFYVPRGINIPNVDVQFNPILSMFWVLARSFLWAIAAILVVLFLPAQTDRMSRTVVAQPLISGGLGLLTAVILPILLIVMLVTIILIPVSLVGLVALMIAWGMGVIVVGTEVGKRMGTMFKQVWALPVAAGLGTFLLTLVTNGISEAVACVGWLAPAVVGFLGLGAVLLTRFGTQPYPTYVPSTSLQPVEWPPAPSPPPITPDIPGPPPAGPVVDDRPSGGAQAFPTDSEE